MKNRLIINADDYGMSPLYDKGILELVTKGIMSSVSVMIKRKYAKTSDLKGFKNISIGLHLELSEKDSEKEIERQIKKFIKRFSRLPSHLDGHKHNHLTVSNLPKTIKAARKYNLPIRSRFRRERQLIKKAKLKTPSRLISWHPKRKKELFKKLNKIRYRVTELICHPGYYDKKSMHPYNKQRMIELKILKSREFKRAISRYKIINYYEI